MGPAHDQNEHRGHARQHDEHPGARRRRTVQRRSRSFGGWEPASTAPLSDAYCRTDCRISCPSSPFAAWCLPLFAKWIPLEAGDSCAYHLRFLLGATCLPHFARSGSQSLGCDGHPIRRHDRWGVLFTARTARRFHTTGQAARALYADGRRPSRRPLISVHRARYQRKTRWTVRSPFRGRGERSTGTRLSATRVTCHVVVDDGKLGGGVVRSSSATKTASWLRPGDRAPPER